jgi:hypothetical protein
VRTPVSSAHLGGILLRPEQSFFCVVVGDAFASTRPESDVSQVGLCQLQVGEGNRVAVDIDVPFVSDVFQYSNLAHGLEYAGVAKAMRRLYEESFWLT